MNIEASDFEGYLPIGIVVSGRIVSAIAAELGSMKVTEQIDVLQTFSEAILHVTNFARNFFFSITRINIGVFQEIITILNI